MPRFWALLISRLTDLITDDLKLYILICCRSWETTFFLIEHCSIWKCKELSIHFQLNSMRKLRLRYRQKYLSVHCFQYNTRQWMMQHSLRIYDFNALPFWQFRWECNATLELSQLNVYFHSIFLRHRGGYCVYRSIESIFFRHLFLNTQLQDVPFLSSADRNENDRQCFSSRSFWTTIVTFGGCVFCMRALVVNGRRFGKKWIFTRFAISCCHTM